MDKKNAFQLIITAFHEKKLPTLYQRDIKLPHFDKAIAITGVRRSGKTFLVYQEIKALLDQGVPLQNILYINFEDDRLTPLELANLNDLLEGYYELYPDLIQEKKYLFLDEIQEIENWEKFVRRLLDTEEVQIYLTGSSSKLLSYDISTSMRGRSLHVQVLPLSFKEFIAFQEIKIQEHVEFSSQRFELKKLLEDYIAFGGFPEVVLTTTLKWEILKDYYDLILYKDIVERYTIRNSAELKKLVKYLLTNVGNLFSINKYLKLQQENAGSSKNTVYEYYSDVLESKIIYAVQYFSYSLKAQQVNPVKIYCIDTGLRKVVSFQFSEDQGRLVENIVFLELMRQKKEINYWKGKNEVDFIVKEKNGTLTAINVVYGDEIPEREITGLLEARDTLKCNKLVLLTKDTKREEQGIEMIPVWIWLLKGKE